MNVKMIPVAHSWQLHKCQLKCDFCNNYLFTVGLKIHKHVVQQTGSFEDRKMEIPPYGFFLASVLVDLMIDDSTSRSTDAHRKSVCFGGW